MDQFDYRDDFVNGMITGEYSREYVQACAKRGPVAQRVGAATALRQI